MNAITIGAALVLALLAGLAISYASIAKIIRIRRTPTTWISALPSEGWEGPTLLFPQLTRNPVNSKGLVSKIS